MCIRIFFKLISKEFPRMVCAAGQVSFFNHNVFITSLFLFYENKNVVNHCNLRKVVGNNFI